MSGFPVNTHRFDPYKNFKFKVNWDGKYVIGVSKISGLKRTTEVICHREGGDPSLLRRSPGTTEYSPIILERGITQDTAFEDWANFVHNMAGDSAMSLKNYRKDINIDLFNEQGALVHSYIIYRCWVSEYEAMVDLDANCNAIAIERIVIQNEGWERDTEVKEPKET